MKNAFKPFIENKITFRCAKKNDAKLLFKFINLEEIRKYSFSREKIDYNEHIDWFNKKIESKDSLIIIAENKDEDLFIGQVRYDKISKDIAEVSIYLNPSLSGNGLGPKLLKYTYNLAFDLLNIKEIIAHIKRNNLISIKAFKKAGFKFLKFVKIKNCSSIKMKLKNESHTNK